MPDYAPVPSLSAWPQWKKNLPMQLTWARIATCPPIIALLLIQDRFDGGALCGYGAAALFITASITDFFDGSLARRYDAVSTMGKFMDPIADKILVSSILIMLLPSGRIDPVLVLLLLSRDILIGGIRSIAAADNVVIDAKAAGKWKTGMQMTGIPMLLVRTPIFGIPLSEIGYALLWVSLVLSVYSGIQYARLYFRNRTG